MDARVHAKWRADLSTEWAAFTAQLGFRITDNASGHDASVTSDRLDISWMPPNITERFQPCDQGAINATKTTYKRGMTRDMPSAFDEQF